MGTRNYGLISSVEELSELIDKITGNVFAFDIETGYDGPDREKAAIHPETAFIVGISFTDSTDWARYVPLRHDDGENLDNTAVARLFWPLLNTGLGVAHNAGFELRHLAKLFRTYLWDDPDYGEAVRASNGYFPIRSDTQVEAYLAAEFQRFGLKPLTMLMFDRHGNPVDASRFLDRAKKVALINKIKDETQRKQALREFDGHIMTELFDLFPDLPKNRRKMLRFNVLPLTTQVVEYACEDSVWCLAIHEYYYPQVSQRLVYKFEHAIVQNVVPSMEDEGVLYAWLAMRRKADELRSFKDKYNAEIMTKLTELAGEPVAVNLASPPQIGKILYEKLGYRTNVYTDATRDLPPDQRKMSTGKIALERLAKQYPVVQMIREWKQITRLLGTYLDKYETVYNYADDGRAHPNHMSAFVITGRFAVGDPPYQQSPKKYHYDLAEARAAHAAGETPAPGTCFVFNFRDMIIAPPDYYILGYDLSQAELRAIAGEAQEHALLEAFANGDDVHRVTASLMLGIPLDEVTAEQRDIGKMLNFALLYGMSVKGLADRLAISEGEAQALMDKYFAGLPGIANYMAKMVEHGRAKGYVTSAFGRILPIWEYHSEKRSIRAKGDRACVNYPIQGAATGDYMKIAMVRAVAAIKKAGLSDRVKLVMNIHDALEFYVHKSLQPQDVIAVLKPAVVFDVPGWPQMRADWHIGRKWGSPMEIVVGADGSLKVKGEKTYELTAPTTEVDEDGELFDVLPEVDVDLVRQVANTDAKHLLLTMTRMPHHSTWRGFMSAARTARGINTLTVVTPEGDLKLPFTVSFSPDQQSELAEALGDEQLTARWAATTPA